MAKKSSKGYFGLNWIVSVILAIIPVTSFLLGFLTRLNEKKIRCCSYPSACRMELMVVP